MGVFDTYCSFCAGPLDDAKQGWLSYLDVDPNRTWPPKDGEWRNPPGYAVPTKPVDEIVTISDEDGETWADFVCVGQTWPGYVSPPCVMGEYGAVEIDGDKEWMNDAGRFLRIHRVCLSFLCRRLSVTPEAYWKTLYAPESDYVKYGERGNGLLYCLKYYDMDGRNGQDFGYATACQTPHEDNHQIVDRWDDPDSMEDTAWLLSRPNALPAPRALEPSAIKPPQLKSDSLLVRLLDVPVLFDAVLEKIFDVPQEIIAEELDNPSEEFDAPSLISAVKTLLLLTQVDRSLYRAIVRDRQGLFLRFARQFGWMLPSTPLDWTNWSTPLTPALQQDVDWRAYLLTCLKKEEPHIRNRWRMHRMTVQIARGRTRKNEDGEVTWQWSAGKLGIKSELEKPTPYEWEVSPTET